MTTPVQITGRHMPADCQGLVCARCDKDLPTGTWAALVVTGVTPDAGTEGGFWEATELVCESCAADDD